jgi:hypothetical protein
MAHKEFGFQQVEKFTREVAPYGHPDSAAKLVGKGITVMFSPLPRNKRARNPRQDEIDAENAGARQAPASGHGSHLDLPNSETKPVHIKYGNNAASNEPQPGFSNNPFDKIDLGSRQEPPSAPAGES